MSRRFWFSVFLVVGISAGPALAALSLVPLDPAAVTNGNVYLMEGVSTNVPDDSANNNSGVLIGSPQIVAGLNGKALQFNGTSDGIQLPDATTINTSTHQNKTVIAVFNCADVSKPEKQCVYDEGGSTRGLVIYVTAGLVYVAGWNRGDYTPQWNPGTFLSAPIRSNEWHVVAAVLRGGDAGQKDDKFEMWMDGALIAKGPGGEFRSRSDDNGIANVQQQTNFHDGTVNAGYWFGGLIDEVWILNQALSPDVLSALRTSRGYAKNPVPAKGATDVPADGLLSWDAGEFAQTHDVFLGTTLAEVGGASRTDAKGVLASQGQGGTTFDPPGLLAYGQTYYWRIDEVNQAPDNTIVKGDVWSFTVEPYAYPVKPASATASSYQVGMGPEKTIDGSGLTGDLHGTVETTMWLSAGTPPNWIQYEFDKVYKLHQIVVWNSNQLIEGFVGFGAKQVTIETSTDGNTWAPVANVPEFNRASGTATYAANTTVSLGGVEAKYVKLTINSSWGGQPVAGLSEVRFLYVPVQARIPQPATAATGVSIGTDLNWRPGREAASHKVYFGADQAAVASGTVPAQTVTDHSFTPASLNLGTTYYWRVDEVNAVTYPGDVWSFTTQDYKVVDDFETYTDLAGAEVFSTWMDGYVDKSSGSTVGLTTSKNGTYGETTIIHGGKQSIPLAYDNTAKPYYSEAVRTFATPQDWTASGIKSLSLWFQGVAGNGGQLYVKINSTKVAYDGDAADLARTAWQVWNVDLSKAGKINSVRSLTIGIEGTGAKGTLYIDDIRLYPTVPGLLTPADPGTKGLVAYYKLDGDAKDSAGTHHGTLAGQAKPFIAGKVGQAFNVTADLTYITVPYAADLALSSYTVAAWVNYTDTNGNRGILGTRFNSDNTFDLKVDATRIHGDVGNGTAWLSSAVDVVTAQGGAITTGVWHHILYAVEPGVTRIYLDGALASTVTYTGTPLFMKSGQELRIGCSYPAEYMRGAIDEVRIYNRALSAAEAASLAGRPGPVFQAP